MKNRSGPQRRSSAIQQSDGPRFVRIITAEDVQEKLRELFTKLGIDVPRPPARKIRTSKARRTHPLAPFDAEVSELLATWHRDTRYLDGNGDPAPIRKKGNDPSFHALARRLVPRINEDELLCELERLGAVKTTKDRLVQVCLRSFPSYEDKRLAADHTLASLHGFICTLEHNLDSEPANSKQLFHRIARNSNLDISELPALKVKVKRHGQSFLESCDGWLLRKPSSKQKKSGGKTRVVDVAIGVYLSVTK